MLTDPIADLLTRIKNASRARKYTLEVPFSNMKLQLLDIMQKKKFIENFEKKNKRVITVNLLPEKQDIEVKRVSKPGQRIYVPSTEIKKVKGGLGISIISTSHGLMTGDEAKKANIGGELICEIY